MSDSNFTKLKIASKIAASNRNTALFFNQKICMLGFSIRKNQKMIQYS
jgi:hypothetical protein